MTGSIYGYVRVSTREQNEDRQLIALREVGVSDKNIFMDILFSVGSTFWPPSDLPGRFAP